MEFTLRRKSLLFLVAFFGILPSLVIRPRPAHAQTPVPVVHAVLFYSPTCPRCEQVMNDYLKTLFDQYGNQLKIIGLDVTTLAGHDLYLAAVERFSIPEKRRGVPTLIVGETVMAGTWEIPRQFPGLIDAYLAQGGVDWPDIPGLWEVIAEPEPGPTPGLILAGDHPITWVERYSFDLLGNTISVVVLIGMLGVLVCAAIVFGRISAIPLTRRRAWAIPGLCVAGLFVAGYLAYVETTQVKAFCGPVGDCNTVQESAYARLFGILPIGILGMAGYVLIIVAWCLGRYGKPGLSSYAVLGMLAMTTFGLSFSIYLTFLEPFVIGATCAWCLTSAILMTLLFWLSLAPAKGALMQIFPGKIRTSE